MGKLLAGLCALAFLVWCASVAFKGMGPAPSIVLETLIDDSAQVTDLDGFVRKGDGYSVQIRFIAESDWIQALRYKGFVETDCETARQKINFSLMRTAAWPPWRPEDLTDVTCFRRFGANEWSPSGRDFVLAESAGGWVYFAGEGREHDKAMPGADKVDYENDVRR